MPVKTLPTARSTPVPPGVDHVTAKRSISEMANMPIISGISPMPPISSALPKVKRGCPAGFSSPTQATSRPSSSDTDALQRVGAGDEDGAGQPSITSQKYSNC
jgi:hypothetical protein